MHIHLTYGNPIFFQYNPMWYGILIILFIDLTYRLKQNSETIKIKCITDPLKNGNTYFTLGGLVLSSILHLFYTFSSINKLIENCY